MEKTKWRKAEQGMDGRVRNSAGEANRVETVSTSDGTHRVLAPAVSQGRVKTTFKVHNHRLQPLYTRSVLSIGAQMRFVTGRGALKPLNFGIE